MGVLDIGITGLRVADFGLQATSHNISNSSTPGYSRQEIKQTTNSPNLTSYGYFGQGANVTTVRRVYSEYLNNQVLGAETNVGELDSYLALSNQIDNLLADPNAGLAPAMSTFFQATQQMAADPSSVPARQSLLSSSQALVSRFQALDQRMGEIRDGVNSQLISEVTTINAYATQLAELNERIVRASAISQGNPPNDLMDQRDQLIRDLNKEVKVSTITQNDGSINLFIGSGQPLVVGTLQYKLAAGAVSTEDPERITVSLTAPNGATIDMPEEFLEGGTLGGILRFRTETLDAAQNGLGKIATAVALNFNGQHRLGIDLSGERGLNFFSTPQPTVLANSSNAGSATVAAKIVQSDYSLSYAQATDTWTLTRLSGDLFTAGDKTRTFTSDKFPIVVDGMRLSDLRGTAQDGDRYLIKPGNAAEARVIADSDNAGNAKFDSSASNIQSLPAVASDYRLSVTTGGALQMVRLVDGQSWFASSMADLQKQLAADPQGFVLDMKGFPKPGDSFLIEPTRQAVRNMAVNLGDPLKIAAAAPFRTSAALANKGSGAIDLGSVMAYDPAGLPLANTLTVSYQQDVAGNPILIISDAFGAVSKDIPFIPGQPNQINFRGMRFTVSGVPALNDSFTIEKNLNGVSDNRNALALGGLQTASTLNGATGTFAAGYSQVVSFVGNRTREISVTGKAQQALADQAENSRLELSGVNLDEEAANLLRYQQAYQASAKVIEVAGKIFDELVRLGS